MKIAVDAMGGDYAPAAIIAGAGLAARQLADQGTEIILVGIEDVVRAELERQSLRLPNISIHHAPEVVEMDESPRVALRQKANSSVTVSVDLVRDGLADAAISAGNSGAMMAAATMRLRCLPGVQRPAIAVAMPTPIGKRIVLDAGANVDCKPEHLADFALMGSVFAEHALEIERPRVGLLSIGTEDSKGNELTYAATELCRKMPVNFIGNVEGNQIYQGEVDVTVCDGFVGNVVLKVTEGVGQEL
ncbi:MAG: phosphate acyltransferase PlsX, partial [Armatimonadota bacterium]